MSLNQNEAEVEKKITEEAKSDDLSLRSEKSITEPSKKSAKMPEINPEALAEIEREAGEVARDFCELAKQLQLSLNHISAASVCCLQTYRDSVDKYCDSIEDCVKEEQIVLNKAKDLSKTMEPIYKLQQKISQIKTVVTTLENHI